MKLSSPLRQSMDIFLSCNSGSMKDSGDKLGWIVTFAGGYSQGMKETVRMLTVEQSNRIT